MTSKETATSVSWSSPSLSTKQNVTASSSTPSQLRRRRRARGTRTTTTTTTTATVRPTQPPPPLPPSPLAPSFRCASRGGPSPPPAAPPPPAHTASATLCHPAARRLARDLKELVEWPLPGADSRPVDERNLLLWHGNIYGPAPPFADAPLHVLFAFSPTFPLEPPAVRLFTPLPHPNVLRVPAAATSPHGAGRFAVCLDMLRTEHYAGGDSENAGGDDEAAAEEAAAAAAGNSLLDIAGWSPTYTVRAVLMQLQEFLLGPKLGATADPTRIAEAARAAAAFECPLCPHRGSSRPWPAPVPSISDFEDAAGPAPAVWIERPDVFDLVAPASGGTPSQRSVQKAAKVFTAGAPTQRTEKRGPANVARPETASSRNRKRRQGRRRGRLRQSRLRNAGRRRAAVMLRMDGGNVNAQQLSPNGHFARLPYEVLQRILGLLPARSVLTLSGVSNFFHSLADDGHLWRDLFLRRHPGSVLKAASPADWKQVYWIGESGIAEELLCAFLKTSYKEEVLGTPVVLVNGPYGERTEFLYSSFDLISRTAFDSLKVKSTAFTSGLTAWLPLYLTREHFDKALPYFEKSVARICGRDAVEPDFEPWMVIEVVPQLIRTQLLLLCEGDLHNSEAILVNHFQLQRLFMEAINRYPVLSQQIESQLDAFSAGNHDRRGTASFPCHLTSAFTLTAISPNAIVRWLRVIPFALQSGLEQRAAGKIPMIRFLAVLATLIAHTAASFTPRSTSPPPSQQQQPLAHPPPSSADPTHRLLARAQDFRFGRPPPSFLRALRAAIGGVLAAADACDTDALLQLLRLPPPTALAVERLRQTHQRQHAAPRRSISKLDWIASRALRRRGGPVGPVPLTPSARVYLSVMWRRSVGGGTVQLDACAMMFDGRSSAALARCDFWQSVWPGGEETVTAAAIVHSSGGGGGGGGGGGAQWVGGAGWGVQRLQVDLVRLPAQIRAVALCVAAWGWPQSASLRDAADAAALVRAVDGGVSVEIDRCASEAWHDAGAEDSCAVVCVLERIGDGGAGRGCWRARGLGGSRAAVGPGSVMRYGEIERMAAAAIGLE